MIRSLLVASGALVLTGCVGLPAEGLDPAPLNPNSRYSLQVEPGIERVALAVHDTGLSANQTRALEDIAGRFYAEGAPVLRIEAPSGNDPVASEMAWRIKGALEASGVSSYQVQVVTYVAPDPRAPVLVGFDTVRAVVPQCGTGWTNLTRTGSNAGYGNFGCAVNANLAAQIANPRDIVQPRTMTPVDAGRRAVVFDNYRQGEQTAAPQEDLVARTQVSRAVD
ncbi:CpaD family pilus assembly protein [Brevundimonas subvibrioides]|uniref:Pilus (Caulobacter type) biogenesis lipoprotein CpaD n=1 Tax=Brevundimonas subvibrioides (strain ATCC 15264 / DSM 4735 / LMG 14903 / NBRC 16000 / CB 81) TaxID=633149 RepID=D9QL99_BRESC|nr:CpaD family pilus assembly protein [Brevundimonas subvibrioides]ADK99954.1 pilus (Caulobacter type) biogenesis lipoprotein CpaD [Brevundimonas subvibrioides ATCC 15264]